MKYRFVSFGGNGSRYLIDSLRRRYHVADKPDAVFQSVFDELFRALHIDDDTLLWLRQQLFKRRAGLDYEVTGTTPVEILQEYLKETMDMPTHTVVFNTAFEFNFFSRAKIDNLVFQIRHPLQGYQSFTKPERHQPLIKHLGGPHSRSAATYYATRWRQAVEEYQRLQDSGLNVWLLRYEHINEDLNNLPDLRWVYEDFDQSRRNVGRLPTSIKRLIEAQVATSFEVIYPRWEL
jgi:hypothetical protein